MLSQAMLRRHDNHKQTSGPPVAKSRRGCIRKAPAWWEGLHPNDSITTKLTTLSDIQADPANRPPPFNEGGDPTKSVLDAVPGSAPYKARVMGKTQPYKMTRPWAKQDEFGPKKQEPLDSVTLPVPYDPGEEQRLVYCRRSNLRLAKRLAQMTQGGGSKKAAPGRAKSAGSPASHFGSRAPTVRRPKTGYNAEIHTGPEGFLKNSHLWTRPLQLQKDYKNVITHQIDEQAPNAAEVAKVGGICTNPAGATQGGAAGAPCKLARKARQDLDKRDVRKVRNMYSDVHKRFMEKNKPNQIKLLRSYSEGATGSSPFGAVRIGSNS